MRIRKLMALLISVMMLIQMLSTAITTSALGGLEFPDDSSMKLIWSEDFEGATGNDGFGITGTDIHFPYNSNASDHTLEISNPISGNVSISYQHTAGGNGINSIGTKNSFSIPGKYNKFTQEIKFAGEMPSDFSLVLGTLTWKGSANWPMQITYHVVDGELTVGNISLNPYYTADKYMCPEAAVEKLGEGHYRLTAKFTGLVDTDGNNTVMLFNSYSSASAFTVLCDNWCMYSEKGLEEKFPDDSNMQVSWSEDMDAANNIDANSILGTALYFPYGNAAAHSIETVNPVSGTQSIKYTHTGGTAEQNSIGTPDNVMTVGKYSTFTQEIQFVGDVPNDFSMRFGTLTWTSPYNWPMQATFGSDGNGEIVFKNSSLLPKDYYTIDKYMDPAGSVEKLGEGHYRLTTKFIGIPDGAGNNSVMLFNVFSSASDFTLLMDNWIMYTEKEPAELDVYPENLTAKWTGDFETATGEIADAQVKGTDFGFRWNDAATMAQYYVADVSNAATKSAVISGNKSIGISKSSTGSLTSMTFNPNLANKNSYIMNFKLKPLGETGELPDDFAYSLVAMRWAAPNYFFTYKFSMTNGKLEGSLVESDGSIYTADYIKPVSIVKEINGYYSIALKFTGVTDMFFYSEISGSACEFSIDEFNVYDALSNWKVGGFAEKTKGNIFNENFEKATIVETASITGTNGFVSTWAGLNNYYSVTTAENEVISGKKSIVYEGIGYNRFLQFGAGVTHNDTDYKLTLQLKPLATINNGSSITLHNMSYSTNGPAYENYLFSACYTYIKASNEWVFSYSINSDTIYPKQPPQGAAYVDENGIINIGLSYTDSLDALGKDNNNWIAIEMAGNLKLSLDNVRYLEAPLNEGVTRYFAPEEDESGDDYDDNVYYAETATPIYSENFENATGLSGVGVDGTLLSFPISGLEDYHYITGLDGSFPEHSISGNQSLGMIAAGALTSSVEIPTSFTFGQYNMYTFKIKANTEGFEEQPDNNFEYSVFGYTLNGSKDRFFEVKLSGTAGVITGAQVTKTDAYPFEMPTCKYVTDENGVTTVVIKFRGGKSTDGQQTMKLRSAFSGDFAFISVDDLAVYKSSSVTALENFLPKTGELVYAEGLEAADNITDSDVTGSMFWDVYGGMSNKFSLITQYSDSLNGSKSLHYAYDGASQNLAFGNGTVRFMNDAEYKVLFKMAANKVFANGDTIKLHYRAWEGSSYLFTVTYAYNASTDSWVSGTTVYSETDYAKQAPIGFVSKSESEGCYNFGLSFIGSTATTGTDGVTFVAFEFSGNYDVVLDDFEIYTAPLGESAGRYVSAVSKPVVEGDVDNNGVFNATDIVTLRKHLLGCGILTSDYSISKADSNGDKKINIIDLVHLKKLLAQ